MTFAAAVWAALLLGISTSISPCPLATNIAAVSYIGKQVANRKLAVLSGRVLFAGARYRVCGAGWGSDGRAAVDADGVGVSAEIP